MNVQLTEEIKTKLFRRGTDIDLAAVALIDLLIAEVNANKLILVAHNAKPSSPPDNITIPIYIDPDHKFGTVENPKEHRSEKKIC